jgi:hypothetical protein
MAVGCGVVLVVRFGARVALARAGKRNHAGQNRAEQREQDDRLIHALFSLAHDLIRKPVAIPDRGRGHAFRDHALSPSSD